MGNGGIKLEDDRVAHINGAALGEVHLDGGMCIGVRALQLFEFFQFALVEFLALASGVLLFFKQLGQAFGALVALLLLFLLFLDLGVGFAPAEADGISNLFQFIVVDDTLVSHGSNDGIGLDERRVGYPVENRVVGRSALHAEPVVAVLSGLDDV